MTAINPPTVTEMHPHSREAKCNGEDETNLMISDKAKILRQNYRTFLRLLDRAEQDASRGNDRMAVVRAEIAALWATHKHAGIFASAELEGLLVQIGSRHVRTADNTRKRKDMPEHVLHVVTYVTPIGGHTRMLWRWIEADASQKHSVAFTRQSTPIPAKLREAVQKAGGAVHRLNATLGGPVEWAGQLRELAQQVDLVILHVNAPDSIPVLAFSQPDDLPPVVFIDIADHMFWLGVSISDLVVNLRQSGMGIALGRRGVEPERTFLLPTIIDGVTRSMSREAAKAKLDIPANSVLILSVARSVKYRNLDNLNFLDVHLPVLNAHKETVLVVVGAGHRPDWQESIDHVPNQIIVLEEIAETQPYFCAADIYVDSFPFVSTTSLLEAGAHGLPLVSRFIEHDDCEILSVTVPGVANSLILSRSDQDYQAALSRLIRDKAFRETLGERTRKEISDVHMLPSWLSSVKDLYKRAMSLKSVKRNVPQIQAAFDSKPDVLLPAIFGLDLSIPTVLRTHLRIMPTMTRIRVWFSLLKSGELRDLSVRGGMKLLAPEWFIAKCKKI